MECIGNSRGISELEIQTGRVIEEASEGKWIKIELQYTILILNVKAFVQIFFLENFVINALHV
jgi:hypothetical protein